MPTPSTSSEIFTFTGSTGNPLLDAMLGPAEIYQVSVPQRSTIVGQTVAKWGGPVGTGVNLTYSFISPLSVFSANYPDQKNGVLDVPDSMKINFRLALNEWAAVANVSFQEVQETTSSVGDIRIGVTSTSPDQTNDLLHHALSAYSPSQSIVFPRLGVAGDIWATAWAATFDWNTRSPFQSALHELGHAIFSLNDVSTNNGLNGSTLPASINYFVYTTMSYSQVPGSTPSNQLDNTQGGTQSSYPTTPMVLDILAAQYIYGPNINYHAGDDLYEFLPGQTYFETIWDAGGTNTFSVAHSSHDCVIDLRPGNYSDVGTVITVTSHEPIRQETFTKTVGIAYGVTIANAIGGSGNDTIIGNDADNRLTGGGGNDFLDGGAGNNTAVYSGTLVQYSITASGMNIIVADKVAGRDGTDTLSNIQYLQFSDNTINLTAIPAVAVEASMYGATGTSAEITSLTNNFLPPQVANATANGLNPLVYACEALGLVFAFGNENGNTAFSNNFGPSNSAMPNTSAGDTAFAASASSAIFGSASTANLVNVMNGFVTFWKGFFTANGIPGYATPTAAQIDLAARGTAWGDMDGVALANSLGPLNGQTINFLQDAALGTAVYGASLVGQPVHQPVQGA